MAEQTDAERLAEANETIVGVVENGPWVLITEPALRQLVGGYVADACHSIAAAAGLDEAMERAHDVMPQRLARTLPGQRVALDRGSAVAGQIDAADLPYGSVVVDDVVGVAFYAVEDLGIAERWHESDTVRGDATVDHAIRRGDAQIVRVGTRAAIAPHARERLARHLWIADGGDADMWDRLPEAAARLTEYNLASGSSLRLDGQAEREQFLAQADALLTVITGKDSR